LRGGRNDGDVAIHFVREGKPGIENVTWSALRERTRAAYDAMINSGVQVGDKVAAVISNSVDAIVLCLATLAIGAVWSSASCELGAKAIIDRYDQIKPKLAFVDNAYIYAGKLTNLEDRISQWSPTLMEGNSSLKVVVLPYCNVETDLSRISRAITWAEFLNRGTGVSLSFRQLPFDHPGFILFSSGTVCLPLYEAISR
jgi:acetoacetyl-CoA synthetase